MSEDDTRDVAHLIRLADVRPITQRWLWPGRIPFAAVTVCDGAPGAGKGNFVIDVAARLTTGRPMPFGSANMGPSSVIFLGGPEDDLASTLRTRLDAAGGDPSRVFVLTAVNGDEVQLPRDRDALRRVVEEHNAGLVVVDPITSFVGDGIDLNNDVAARRMLTPLATLARSTGAAVIVVRHHGKNSALNALHRGAGSIGIIGLARCGLAITERKDGAREVKSTKNNFGAKPPTVAYQIEGAPNGASVIRWIEKSVNDNADVEQDNDPIERVMRRVIELERAKPGHHRRVDVCRDIGIRREVALMAIRSAVAAGMLVGDGARGAVRLPVEVKVAAA